MKDIFGLLAWAFGLGATMRFSEKARTLTRETLPGGTKSQLPIDVLVEAAEACLLLLNCLESNCVHKILAALSENMDKAKKRSAEYGCWGYLWEVTHNVFTLSYLCGIDPEVEVIRAMLAQPKTMGAYK